MNGHQTVSSVLLAGGVVLVFAGLSSALGFSLAGIFASVAAIAALLYAGGIWFGDARRAEPSVLLFTRTLIVAGGALAGRPVADLFPAAMRGDIEARCRDALAGNVSHFSCGAGPERVSFSATPVRDAAGAVTYGLLLSGSLVTKPDAAAAV